MASKLNIDSLPIHFIPTAKIHPNRYNPSSPSPQVVEAIVKDVKRNGPHAIRPIFVRRLGRGFELVDGEKRWRAFRRLRIGKIASQVSTLDEDFARSLAYRMARERGEIDPFREAELFSWEKEHGKKSLREIAEEYNVTEVYVRSRLLILNVAPRIRRLVPHGTSASYLEVIGQVKDPRNQEELVGAIEKYKLTVHEAQNRANWLNEGRIVPRSPEEASDDEASKVEKDLARGLELVRDIPSQGPVDRELLRDSQGGDFSFYRSDEELIDRVQSILSCVEFSAKGVVGGKEVVLEKAELTVRKVLDRKRLEEALYVYV